MDLVIGVAVMLVAGIVQGCTGFGLALVAAPCLFLVMDARSVVPTLVLCSTFNTLLVIFEGRRYIQPNLVLPILLGGIVGTPLGVHALKVADDVHIKVAVAVFVVVVAIALLKGWRMPLGQGPATKIPVGILSGILGGSTAMCGPPIVFFLANNETPKDVFRVNLASYFFFLEMFTVGVFFYRDMLTWRIAAQAATFFPTLIAGSFLGILLSRRVSGGPFRRAVMILVAATGILLLVTNVRALLS